MGRRAGFEARKPVSSSSWRVYFLWDRNRLSDEYVSSNPRKYFRMLRSFSLKKVWSYFFRRSLLVIEEPLMIMSSIYTNKAKNESCFPLTDSE